MTWRRFPGVVLLILVATRTAAAQPSSLSFTRYKPNANYLRSVAPGPDGALWFTDYYGDAVGRITTDGVIKEYGLSGTFPDKIVAGTAMA